MSVATFSQVLGDLKGNAVACFKTTPETCIQLSFDDLHSMILGNAKHFSEMGVRRGDRVAICLESTVEHVVAVLALMALSAVPVSVKPQRRGDDNYLRYLTGLIIDYNIRFTYGKLIAGTDDTKIVIPALFWDSKARHAGLEVVADADAESVAFVQFSSGSTSQPKPIPITHGNLMDNLETIVSLDGRSASSLVYNFVPLNHDMGFVGGLLSNFLVRNSFILSPIDLFRRRPQEILRTISERRIHILPRPDFALRVLARVIEAGYGRRLVQDAFASIETIYIGAEPIRETTVSRFLASTGSFGFDPSALYFCYGLAEATLIATGRRFDGLDSSFRVGPSGHRIARLGEPVGRIEVSIDRDPNGSNRPGAIRIRGPNVFPGYLNQSQRTPEEWFDTSDLGVLDGGELVVSGTRKDMIIVGGENVFMVDVEDTLNALPVVKESLAMAHGDRFSVLLVLQPRVSVDVGAVGRHLADRFDLSPEGIATGVSADIARTTSGKPMRDSTLRALRDRGALTKERDGMLER